MAFSLIYPPRRDTPELIDQTGHDFALFRDSFYDIRIVNRYFGGTSAVLNPLVRMIDRLPKDQTATVLDIGTGSADIPLALSARLRKRGKPVRITALDNHPDVLRVAEEATAGDPDISVARGDALSLPYPDRSFDVAMCSLTFHHLGEDGCVKAMREMDRVTRLGWVVNDGERLWITLFLLKVVTPFVTRNPLTLHDGMTSVWRGFTAPEMRALARRAGFPDARVYRRPICRIVVDREKPVGSA